jgi:hypothetical protein
VKFIIFLILSMIFVSPLATLAADFPVGSISYRCFVENQGFGRQYLIEIKEASIANQSLPLIEVQQTFPDKTIWRGIGEMQVSNQYLEISLNGIKVFFRNQKITGIKDGLEICD